MAMVMMRRRDSGVTGFLKPGMYLLASGFSLIGVLTLYNLEVNRDNRTPGCAKLPTC
jgi:hypothetical protein